MADRFEETAQMLWAHGSPPFGPEEAVLKFLTKTLRSMYEQGWDEAVEEVANACIIWIADGVYVRCEWASDRCYWIKEEEFGEKIRALKREVSDE